MDMAKQGAPELLDFVQLGRSVYQNKLNDQKQAHNKIEMMLLLEFDYLYGKHGIDLKKLKIDDSKCILEYGDQRFEVEPEDLGSIHFYLHDFELAEKYLRLTVKEMSVSATAEPRSDKYILRLARCFREEREYLLADALVKCADEFICSHYSEDSPLRVCSIEEKYRLLRIQHADEEASALLASARSRYSDYINRLNSIEEQYSRKITP